MSDRTISVAVCDVIEELEAGPEAVWDVDGHGPAWEETGDILVDEIR